MAQSFVTGVVIGTGAAMNVQGDKVGFRPSVVRVHNRTRNSFAIWTDRMPAASMQKVVDSGAGTTDVSFVTANGVTQLCGGFTLGADANLNGAGDEIHFECWG
jgi:hypothetical protein